MPDARPRIQLLSCVSLTVDGSTLDRLPTRRIQALIGYLALHPGWLPRERVAEAIWPDLPEGKASASLRNALSVVRRLFEPKGPAAAAVLESTRTDVRLCRAVCECDVWDFQEAVARRDWHRAIEVYAGDLIPDLYDEWIEPCREDLRSAYRRALASESGRSEDPGPVQPKVGVPKQRPRTLPVYLSRYFGRDAELRKAAEWIHGPSQLLTVLGMGGIGKTRLSVEAARAASAEGMEIAFVSLTAYDSEIGLVFALADALNLRESESETIEQAIKSYLGGLRAPLVLILDNLEQILKPTVSVIMDLLPLSENLKFLCTSRELLGIEGEQLLSLSPLAVMGGKVADSLPVSSEEEAVQMFVDRARTSRADFALTARNHREVADLCRELEGLPLAIEIAAGWSGAWSVAEIRSTVRANRLVGRKRGHDPRHQSLDACIEWSYNLLEPKERQFLSELSLFRGGWSTEAAEAVTGFAESSHLLAALVDRSLVTVSENETGLRFGMLESVRNYFRSRLCPDTASGAAPRFAEYFRDLALVLADPCAGADEGLNHRKLDLERENIEAVAALCEEGLVPVDTALALAGQLHLHWAYRGQVRMGIALIDRIRAVPSDEPHGTGFVLGMQGLCALVQDAGDPIRAEQTLDEFRRFAEEEGNLEIRFRALTQMGNFLQRHGRYREAKDHQQRALSAAQTLGRSGWMAAAHCNYAEALFGLNLIGEALPHWKTASELDLESGNLAGDAVLYLGFGEALTGNPERGLSRLTRYIIHVHSVGFTHGCLRAIYYAALPVALLGSPDLARQFTSRAMALIDRKSHRFDTLECECFEKIDEAILRAESGIQARAGPSSEVDEAAAVINGFFDSQDSQP